MNIFPGQKTTSNTINLDSNFVVEYSLLRGRRFNTGQGSEHYKYDQLLDQLSLSLSENEKTSDDSNKKIEIAKKILELNIDHAGSFEDIAKSIKPGYLKNLSAAFLYCAVKVHQFFGNCFSTRASKIKSLESRIEQSNSNLNPKKIDEVKKEDNPNTEETNTPKTLQRPNPKELKEREALHRKELEEAQKNKHKKDLEKLEQSKPIFQFWRRRIDRCNRAIQSLEEIKLIFSNEKLKPLIILILKNLEEKKTPKDFLNEIEKDIKKYELEMKRIEKNVTNLGFQSLEHFSLKMDEADISSIKKDKIFEELLLDNIIERIKLQKQKPQNPQKSIPAPQTPVNSNNRTFMSLLNPFNWFK